MSFIQDVRAKFPKAYSCAGELIDVVDGKLVVLGAFADGSFNLTKRGQELFEAVADEPKAEPVKRAKKAKVEDDPLPELDSLLGE